MTLLNPLYGPSTWRPVVPKQSLILYSNRFVETASVPVDMNRFLMSIAFCNTKIYVCVVACLILSAVVPSPAIFLTQVAYIVYDYWILFLSSKRMENMSQKINACNLVNISVVFFPRLLLERSALFSPPACLIMLKFCQEKLHIDQVSQDHTFFLLVHCGTFLCYFISLVSRSLSQ